MKLYGALVLAFSMYSKIPMPKPKWDKQHMEHVFCFFPLVGFVVGGFLWLWWQLSLWLALTPVLTAAGCVLLPLLVTGGIHMDGFCDVTDALSSHQDKARKLEILKDSHVGAFALIGCVCFLLVQFAVWTQAAVDNIEILPLTIVPVLSRCLSGLTVVCRKNARGSGMLATFTDALTGKRVRVVLVLWTACAAAALLWADLLTGMCMLTAAGLVWVYTYAVSQKQFGGMTGDLAGWFLQLCELGCVTAAVFVGRMAGLWF